MQFAHNGYYKGSTPLGLMEEKKKKESKIFLLHLEKEKAAFLSCFATATHKRAFGRVWFMALVLKTSTLQKS